MVLILETHCQHTRHTQLIDVTHKNCAHTFYFPLHCSQKFRPNEFSFTYSFKNSSLMARQPRVGFGLHYNTPLSLSIPCSVSPFIYSHLSQARGHVIQQSHFWSSSSSCCIHLSIKHLFWDCGVLHSFYMTKPSYSLAFNKPDNVLPFSFKNYCP